jgi:transposase
LPHVSAEAMSLHLAEISTQVAPGAQALLVLDGAGWHQTGGQLRVPGNITLLPLPPYAPELNPVETIWEHLRGNRLSFQIWDNYEAIRDACCDAWNALLAAPDLIKSIAASPWASVNL